MSDIKITLLFANYDNTSKPVLVTVPVTTKCAAVKSEVLKHWPAAYERPLHDDVNNFTSFAFGRMLADDNTFEKIPKFDWPTPVHVALRAGQASASKGGEGARRAAPNAAASSARPAAVIATSAPPPTEESGCCVIS